mmetsp:Transcript_56739/g.166055  ORF Transcript_56739/g.166055 Transcript_56739/m.166055 type:complete len:267 (-) Transcript_56739:44-844(-)
MRHDVLLGLLLLRDWKVNVDQVGRPAGVADAKLGDVNVKRLFHREVFTDNTRHVCRLPLAALLGKGCGKRRQTLLRRDRRGPLLEADAALPSPHLLCLEVQLRVHRAGPAGKVPGELLLSGLHANHAEATAGRSALEQQLHAVGQVSAESFDVLVAAALGQGNGPSVRGLRDIEVVAFLAQMDGDVHAGEDLQHGRLSHEQRALRPRPRLQQARATACGLLRGLCRAAVRALGGDRIARERGGEAEHKAHQGRSHHGRMQQSGEGR